MKNLMVTRRFFPLFMAQFLGVFNDNLFKNALVIMATYRVAQNDMIYAAQLVNLAFAIYILPSFLFSPLAGQIADKFDRDKIARATKAAEIALVILGAGGLFLENLPMLYATLFGFGLHSNFFGPIKMAMLPQHLEQHELATGNAYMEAGSFLAILGGTITGGVIVLTTHGVAWLAFVMLALAVAGLAASFCIPRAAAPVPHLRLSLNPFKEFGSMVVYISRQRAVFAAILGLSWFWCVAALFLAQFSPFVKSTLFAHENVVTLFLTVFSIGIVAGSLLCGKALGGKIHARLVPYGAFSLSVFAIDLYFSSQSFSAGTAETLLSTAEFLRHDGALRIMFDLFMISLSGGFYTVSLYTLMQHRSEKAHVARTMAVNNLMNALFMLCAAGLSAGMLHAGFSIPQLFLTAGALNLVFAVVSLRFVSKPLP